MITIPLIQNHSGVRPNQAVYCCYFAALRPGSPGRKLLSIFALSSGFDALHFRVRIATGDDLDLTV